MSVLPETSARVSSSEAAAGAAAPERLSPPSSRLVSCSAVRDSVSGIWRSVLCMGENQLSVSSSAATSPADLRNVEGFFIVKPPFQGQFDPRRAGLCRRIFPIYI